MATRGQSRPVHDQDLPTSPETVGEPAGSGDDADDATADGTRRLMLDAGVSLLDEATRDQLRRVLTAGKVSERAGRRRQTFYRYWDTQAEYVDDLIRHVTDPRVSQSSQRLTDLEADARPDPDRPAQEVRRMSGRTFASFTGDPAQVARIVLWAVQFNDDLVAERLGDLHAANDAAAAEAYGVIGELWNLEPRPPFTRESIAVLFNALRDGLQVHLGGEPRVPESFFGDVMVALTTAVTRRIDDPDDDADVDEHFDRRARGDRT